jgi:hypothetical protein
MDYMIKEETLTDIADAIRSKTGGQSVIEAGNFAMEISNIPSPPASININEGRLDIRNATITQSDEYCYTDPFDFPNGTITFDVGEASGSNYAGFEIINPDGTHANYWVGNSRFRTLDLSSYYSPTKKLRMAFKKVNLEKALLIDYGNGKIYSFFEPSRFKSSF